MRTYTEAEKCMMLLYAPLGQEPPLRKPLFKHLREMLKVVGQGEGTDVTPEELRRLGLNDEDAKIVLGRLERREALEEHLRFLKRKGISLLTRISPEYPCRLREVLGDSAPMILYCAGETALFETECVSLVGSRSLRTPGENFAVTLGKTAAAENLTLVSGGAAGADTAGFLGAYRAGGRAILFVADSLAERMRRMDGELASGRLLLVSEYGFDQGFSALRAHSRNRLIHAMGQKTFIAQSDYGCGGTWTGTVENLKHGWSQCFVSVEEPEDPGAKGLVERGCLPLTIENMKDLREQSGGQISLY